MKYFVLDPGSRCLGWSYMDSARRGKILDAGRIIRTKGPYLARIDQICQEIWVEVHSRHVDKCLIEVPSGGVHTRHGGRGEGLSIYGFAVGAIRQSLRHWLGYSAVIDLPVAEWKSGQPKEKAIKVATKHYPPYADMKDPSADIADGIAMAVWYYEFRLRRPRKR